MKIPDVNVLVAAFRLEHSAHDVSRSWLRQTLESGETIGLSSLAITGAVRVLTNRRIWPVPDSLETALGHIDALRQNASAIDVQPGRRHWELFAQLSRDADARGNLVADAAHAAIAVEHGATVVSFDRDFARFPGLRWEQPA